ncbi:MAG: YqaJ viral recombinase family protein [Gammaproteobacteria bacterium]|nr:YqaJ viral recombinase family protein [Gammaproteobacteria bacterium]
MNPDDFQAAWAVLQRLPQAPHCAERMQTWLTTVAERQAQGTLGGLSLAQHLRRLSGIGASEIGVLVGERRGLYQPFSTAREVVAQKLLFDPPEPDNAHLRRGALMEPMIRSEFLRLSGATPRPDLLQKVVETPAQWDWMQATPDELVVMDGRLGIIDYKSPAQPINDVPLEYACQLHQIGLLAQHAGLPVAFRALVAWNSETWRPEVLPCPHDPALEQEIVEAGNHYWYNHILTGELPPWPTVERLDLGLADLPQAAKAEIEALSNRWLRLDLLAKEAATLVDDARQRLIDTCQIHGLGQTVATGAVKITPKPVWDEEAIALRLTDAERAAFSKPRWDTDSLLQQVRELGGDPSPARRAEGSLRLEEAAQWLIRERGIPPEHLQQVEFRTAISRRQADQPLVEPVRTRAGATAFQFGAGP